MARHFISLSIVVFLLLLSSCNEWGVYKEVLEGNYAYSRGDYMSANYDYLKAVREGLFLSRIYYNLGNVYHALDEWEAALEEWERAENGRDTELMYRIAFNRGVLFYEQGSYREAYRYFRRALAFKPDDVEAKINLEYALRKQSTEDGEGAKQAGEGDSDTEVSDDAKRVLDYIERNAPTKLAPESEQMREKEVKDW